MAVFLLGHGPLWRLLLLGLSISSGGSIVGMFLLGLSLLSGVFLLGLGPLWEYFFLVFVPCEMESL